MNMIRIPSTFSRRRRTDGSAFEKQISSLVNRFLQTDCFNDFLISEGLGLAMGN